MIEAKKYSLIINKVEVVNELSTNELITGITSNQKVQEKVSEIRQHLSEDNKPKADELKKGLMGFTPSGTFNGRRSAENIKEYSNLIILDIDKVDDAEDVKNAASLITYTMMAFLSPSGSGVKILAEHNAGLDNHKIAFESVVNYYEKELNVKIDPSGKDIARLCFFSHDPDLFYNEDSKVFEVNTFISDTSVDVKDEATKVNDSTIDYIKLLDEVKVQTNKKSTFHNGSRNDFLFKFSCNANRVGVPIEQVKNYSSKNFVSDDFTIKEVVPTIESAFKNVDEHGEKAPAVKSKYHFTAKELYDRKLTELPTLIEPIVPKKALGLLGGSSDTGKSTFLRQMGLAIAMGKDEFLGFKINATHNRVLYISTEDDDDAIAYLLYTKMKELVQDDSRLNNFHYFFTSEVIEKKIEDFVKSKPVDLVIVHAFSDLYDGDMNMSSKVRPFLDKFSMLAKKYNFSALFLHHTRKGAENNPPSKNNLMGSSGIEQKSRLLIELRKDFNLLGKRHLCIVKQNYLPEEYKTDSYVLDFTDMVFNNTGERVSFSKLGRDSSIEDDRDRWITEAIKLKEEECKTVDEITETLQAEGMQYKRSTVGKWLKGKQCEADQEIVTDQVEE